MLLALVLAAAVDLSGSHHLVNVQAEVPAPDLDLDHLTKSQLRKELRRLEEERPGLAGQISSIIVGGVCIAIGFFDLFISFLVAVTTRAPMIPIAIGVGLVFGGVGLLIFGIVMLARGNVERRPYNERIDEINQRLEGMEHPTQPQYEPAAPPPPPPPPLGAGFEPLPPMMVVARF